MSLQFYPNISITVLILVIGYKNYKKALYYDSIYYSMIPSYTYFSIVLSRYLEISKINLYF